MAALGSNMKGQKTEVKKEVVKKTTKKPVAKATAVLKTSIDKKSTLKPKVEAIKTDTKKKTIAKPPAIKKTDQKKNLEKQQVSTAKTASNKKKVVIPAKEVKPELRSAQFIVEPSKRRKVRKTKVVMEGELNINNVDSFMQLINPLFKDYDFIDFFMREVTSLDLCHIQMLYYYKNHHVKKGKTITIDADVNPGLKKIIVNAGFKELMFIPKLV